MTREFHLQFDNVSVAMTTPDREYEEVKLWLKITRDESDESERRPGQAAVRLSALQARVLGNNLMQTAELVRSENSNDIESHYREKAAKSERIRSELRTFLSGD